MRDLKLLRQASKKANQALQNFKIHQALANQILRSTQVAMQLALDHVEHLALPPDLELNEHWGKKSTLSPILEQYVVFEGGKHPVTVGAFRKHLELGRRHLFESVLVFYLAGFERFLKEWAYAALMLMGNDEAEDHAAIVNTEHRNVRLKHIIKAFQDAAGVALQQEMPLLGNRESSRAQRFYKRENLSCVEVADMWRQIRNVIVHHEGKPDKMEDADIRKLWGRFSRLRPTRQCPVTSVLPINAKRVHLEAHHIVYCFTNTYKTATVLMTALQRLERVEFDADVPQASSHVVIGLNDRVSFDTLQYRHQLSDLV